MCDCLFSSHFSQGCHDLRISADQKFKISKEWKLTVSGIQVSEAPRKSLEVLSLGSSEKIFGTSNLYWLNIQFVRGAVKGNRAHSMEYSFTPRVNPSFPFTARLIFRSTFHRSLSLSLSRWNPHRLSLSTAALLCRCPPSSPSVTIHSHASRVWGRALFLVDRPQKQKMEGEPRRVST
jgi:hypothetical protein